jgi:hypothetical protein
MEKFYEIKTNLFTHNNPKRHTHISRDGILTVCGKDVNETWWITNRNVEHSVSNCPECIEKYNKVKMRFFS